MQTTGFEKYTASEKARYIPLARSIAFLFSRKRLVGLSLLLFLATIFLTWLCYQFSLDFIDSITGGFLVLQPDTATLLGWLQHKGWLILKWLYLIITRVAAFYLAFLVAYTVTTPGYVLLSTSAEKLYAGEDYQMDEGLTLRGILLDLWEGFKIAAFGIVVTVVALFTSFIPAFGLLITFLLYTFYSALMFLDYPASRRRWSLGRKMAWVMRHKGHSFRLGLFPAVVSMIPLLNIFLIALLFPVLTVHATINFTTLELSAQNQGKTDHAR